MEKLQSNKPKYFEIQYLNSKNSIVPFVNSHLAIKPGLKVMEIGSAEGGVLKAFTDLGCECLGVELIEGRVKLANEFMQEEVSSGKAKFVSKNIYDFKGDEYEHYFDLIILKDVIEHIHDQNKFMKEVKRFLKKDGFIFYGFPSWRMPYGGHQQIAANKWASKLPYYHLLPMPLYKGMLKWFGESPALIEGLEEIKITGISTRKFEKLNDQNGFKIIKNVKYFVAPIYEYKFGYKTKFLAPVIAKIPWFNDFFTFQSYYLVKLK